VKEIAALRRIASYVERPKLRRSECRLCGSRLIVKTLKQRLCETCRPVAVKAAKRKSRLTPASRASKSKYKAKRRLRTELHAEAIDPIKVFDRDGWKCKLCGVDTPRSLRGKTSSRSPELDHVIPLSRGGTHTWGNVQCACRKCNGSKGAKIITTVAA